MIIKIIARVQDIASIIYDVNVHSSGFFKGKLDLIHEKNVIRNTFTPLLGHLTDSI